MREPTVVHTGVDFERACCTTNGWPDFYRQGIFDR